MAEESDTKPERRGSAPKPPEAKPPEPLASPKEHALATGNGPRKGKSQWTGPGFSRSMGSVAHEVASVLHGWREHEHHAGEPMKLSRADYLAALKASHPEEGNPVPHPAALSPFKAKAAAIEHALAERQIADLKRQRES